MNNAARLAEPEEARLAEPEEARLAEPEEARLAEPEEARLAEPEKALDIKTKKSIALCGIIQHDGIALIPIKYATNEVVEREKVRTLNAPGFNVVRWYDYKEKIPQKVKKTYMYRIAGLRNLYSPEEMAKCGFPEVQQQQLFSDPFVIDGRVYVSTRAAGKFASLVKERSGMISNVRVLSNEWCAITRKRTKNKYARGIFSFHRALLQASRVMFTHRLTLTTFGSAFERSWIK
jgi:hypothetical protein